MLEQLLNNLKISPSQHWGPQEPPREQFKNLPVGFYNRFEKIGKQYCDLNAFLTNKKLEEQGDEFIRIKGAVKKVPKNPASTKTKVFIKTRGEQKNQQIYKYYSQKWTKTFVRAKQALKTKFKESITVKNDWNKTGTIQPNFEKEITDKVNIQCFKQVGTIRQLKPEIEKISRKEYKLNYKEIKLNTHFTEKDKVLKKLAMKYLEEQPKNRAVILLPQFLLALMTLKFSKYPWHIFVVKQGNTLIMNSHEDSDLTYLDLYAVNENTENNMPDEGRIMDNCRMATQVARSFRDQICSGQVVEEIEYEKDEDDEEDEEEQEQEQGDKLESFKKYMKIGLGNTDFYTYVQVDGAKTVVDPNTEEQYLKYYLTRSLIETETNYEWKNKFEKSAAGHVISGQYLNNSVNWQKWLIESELSGAQHFKISYISESPDSIFNILNVMELTSKNINQNTGFNIKKGWNALKTVVDSLFEGNDGSYIILKSAYQHNLQVFEIPEEEEEEN